MEPKLYTLKENLFTFFIGIIIGVILTLCNPHIREHLVISEELPEDPKVEVIQIEIPITISENEIPSNQISYEIINEEIDKDMKKDEMEMIAQLVQAEAGNQDLMGKRLVVDVILNRIDDPRFPNTAQEVIFQKNPVQFSVTTNGAFNKAKGNIDKETYQAVSMEYEKRTNNGILYFATTPCNGKNHFKHGDHWFGY